jgi:hypothetical protein
VAHAREEGRCSAKAVRVTSNGSVRPSLAALVELKFFVTCSRFDFLRQLPNLTRVFLDLSEPSAAGRFDSLVTGLPCCSQIEDLTLASTEATAAHLNELLPRLPRLRTFCLGDADVTTLAFLAQPPMTEQLTRLVLIKCSRLPLAELRHVHPLQGLKVLCLMNSFDAPMDALSQSLFTPPSLLLPQLELFHYDQQELEPELE